MSALGRTSLVAAAAAAVAAAVMLAACALPPVGPVETSRVVAPPPTVEPTTPEPPVALLSVPDRPPVEGAIGSFTWDGFGSDAPWLPGAGPVHVRQDVLAHVRLATGLEVSEWSARYAPLDGDTVTTDAVALQETGPTAEIDFPAPPAGTWSVELHVRYVGRGSVSYYWRFETTAR